MKDNPLVSIIIPVYNTELYLEKCVESVLGQTYRNIDVILVDDESRDSSPQICDELQKKDERIRVIHKKNGGLSSARNAGINLAFDESQGLRVDYVTFLDSDDWIAPESIETLVNAATAHKSDVVSMCYRTVREDESIISEGSGNTRKCEIFSASEFLKLMCYKQKSESSCVKLYKSSVIEGCRFEEGTLNEDFLFNSTLLLKDINVAHIDYSGYYYLQRQGSTSRSGANKAFFDSIRNPYKLMKVCENVKPELMSLFARVALFQIQCISFVLPYSLIFSKSTDFRDVKKVLHHSIKYIDDCYLPRGYKTSLRLMNVCPIAVCALMHTLYSIKHII